MSHEDYPGDVSALFETGKASPAKSRARRASRLPEARPASEPMPPPRREKVLPLDQIFNWQPVQQEALGVYLDALDRVDQLFDLVAKAERRRKSEGTKEHHAAARDAQQIYVQARQELSDLAAAVGVSDQVLLDLDVGRKASRARIRDYLGYVRPNFLPVFRSRMKPFASAPRELVASSERVAENSEVQAVLGRLARLEERRDEAKRKLDTVMDEPVPGQAFGRPEARRQLFQTKINEISGTIARERRRLRAHAPEVDRLYQAHRDLQRPKKPVSRAQRAMDALRDVVSGTVSRLRRLNPFARDEDSFDTSTSRSLRPSERPDIDDLEEDEFEEAA